MKMRKHNSNWARLVLGLGMLLNALVVAAAPPRLELLLQSGCATSGRAEGVAVSGNRIYVADYEKGLKVLCTVPNVQYMVRVDNGTLGTPYTIEAATNVTDPAGWLPIFTTNPTTLPFEFTDFDVRTAAYPQKFYRVRQP
jgi:hypothetical protein